MVIMMCSLLIQLVYGVRLHSIRLLRMERFSPRGSADDKGQFYMHVKAFEILSKLGRVAMQRENS